MVYIEKEKDPELYKEVYDEAQRLIRISDEIIVTVEKASIKNKPLEKFESKNKNEKAVEKKVDNSIGYCIRTGIQIPFNVKHPMSNEAYQSWAKFSKIEYPEKYCHFSGEP
jgi:hypothetical protein